MFAGYCVGHFNHRYFLLFLAWTWAGVIYCTYLNTVYVYIEVSRDTAAQQSKLNNLLRLVWPPPTL